MRIKWIMLVIFVIIIPTGIVSAVVEQAGPMLIANVGKPTLSFGGLYTSKIGPQEFQVPIYLNNVNDLASMDLSLVFGVNCVYQFKNYDFGKLLITNVEKGSFISNTLFESQISPNLGLIKVNEKSEECDARFVDISFVSSEGISGSGPIATITLSADFPQNSLTVIPDLNPNKGMDPVVVVAWVGILNARDSSGNPIDLSSDLYGMYEVLEWKNSQKGDGDTDGVVSGKDVIGALKVAVGKEEYNPLYDMNNDGKVDSTDAREILKLSLQSSSVQGGSQSTQSGTSANQKELTPETDKIGVSFNERIGSRPIAIRKPERQGGAGRISSIPIQLP